MFIPAFVLSIFLYSYFEYLFIKKNIKYNISVGKNGNVLKIFSKNNKKYNYILAHKDKNGIIEFLSPKSDMSYELDASKTYDLYLYVFWKFDIVRKIIHLGSFDFQKERENDTYMVSKKYADGDICEKIDTLKSSLHQHPYIKKTESINGQNMNHLSLQIHSNNQLEMKWNQNLDFLHTLLIVVGTLGLMIEWQDVVFSSILALSVVLCIIAKRKRIILSPSLQNTYMLIAFVFMLVLSAIYRDMSGAGSVFLIQLLLLTFLTPKGSKNSFLFIFLMLFVFVAISLFSSQIRFILLFLLYLFISTYLLFFISGNETFDDKNYKIWNPTTRFQLTKTFLFVMISIVVFYFVLPHGNTQNRELWLSKQGNNTTTSWFSEEVKFENVQSIAQDNSKSFVIEDIDEKQVEHLWLKYFRGMRFDQFDGSKWDSKFKNLQTNFISNYKEKNTQELTIHYYLKGGKNIFLPNTVLQIEDRQNNMYYNVFNDTTLLKIDKKIDEGLILKMKFPKAPNGTLIDTISQINRYDFTLDENVKKRFERFFKTIPSDITDSPEKLTQFVKNKAGFEYSIDNPAINIEDFLYGKKQGHCEYFATVLAVTLQNYGFPATLVNGFANGEYNEMANSFIIRGKNAHSWVEIYDEVNKKWIIYDATPADYNFVANTYNEYIQPLTTFYDYLDIKWYTYIVNYTGEEQKKFFNYLKDNFWWGVFFAFLWGLLMYTYLFIKRWYFFLRMNKKEKMVYLFSIILWVPHFSISEIEKKDKKLAQKYRWIIYGNQKNISYFEFLADLYTIKKL